MKVWTSRTQANMREEKAFSLVGKTSSSHVAEGKPREFPGEEQDQLFNEKFEMARNLRRELEAVFSASLHVNDLGQDLAQECYQLASAGCAGRSQVPPKCRRRSA